MVKMKIDTQLEKMLCNAGIQLIAGEFIEKCKEIPANSISLIYIDPPYDRWWLPLYRPLGELAFTVLEEGGSLVMNAQSYSSPQIFDCMKPLLWYAKGPRPKILEFIKDSVESKRPDKTLHLWIQSTDEAEHVISKLTNPNVVLDPLIGTGTTAIAALKLNRRFIGIDVSAEMLATARNRISQPTGYKVKM